jgi:tRNA modification GTPase
MNALLGKDRAIVSPTPGTTRDLVEDDLRLGSLHLRLIDTAGIRKTTESIEEEGILRSKRALESADIVLYVLDVTNPQRVDVDLPPEKTIAIWNKIDLEHERPLPELGFDQVVKVSAQKREGLQELQEAIERLIWQNGAPKREELVITSLRHKEALSHAHQACSRVVEGLIGGISAEFVAFDMREALQALGQIIGSNITEDVLNSIFSKFCIGK